MERGELKAIVFPYRDRSDRSIAVMTEVVERVDAAGGLLIAGGSVLTHKSADQWARSVLESFANEMPARYAKEKVRAAHVDAVADGIAPYAPVPGYAKGKDGRFVVVRKLRKIIVEAFDDARPPRVDQHDPRYLAEHGIVRSYAGRRVDAALRDLHRQRRVRRSAQGRRPRRRSSTRTCSSACRSAGRRAGVQSKSDRLLARQGVLVCATCGARMTATNDRADTRSTAVSTTPAQTARRAPPSQPDGWRTMVVNRLKARAGADASSKGARRPTSVSSCAPTARQAKADLEAAMDAFQGVEGLGAAKTQDRQADRALEDRGTRGRAPRPHTTERRLRCGGWTTGIG